MLVAKNAESFHKHKMIGEIDDISHIFKALHFAAHKHQHQRRKNEDATPYINHLIDVAYILADIGEIQDIPTLVAAILHDTVEDTDTLPEELEAEFGTHIRSIVEEVTDDKNLPKQVRKQLQIERAADASSEARSIKLADKIANLQDLIESPPAKWSFQRKIEYVNWAEAVIHGLCGTNAKLETRFDDVCQEARKRFGQ
jgi:guanosine-3',5'-bis(diphosphate) 3'-pyrophosphohydrolase